MDQRYNYFHQNPNCLVNGQSTFNRSSTDSTQPTNNYSGSISSTSSRDESPFHEKKHINSNEIPLMNSHLYKMIPSNQPPRSSGPPRTNVKGIYENSQSSIPNALNLAHSNAENYPINPDFQLQPHLTGLLPQQSKKVPEHYPVNVYSTSKESTIATNMDTNYFSTNKSYPEPKIIEYDMDDTSTTESSPQHTSSLYSESTDQDSESIHQSNLFTRHILPKQTESHVIKESNTITSSNEEFPVPSQFADLSLNRDNDFDDRQHSILNNAYDHGNEDVIEDIPLSDNINQNEINSNLENQENPKSHINEQNFIPSKDQIFDYYDNKKDFSQTELNYENKQDSSSFFNNKTNLRYNVNNSLNNQNSSQFNKESYVDQSNTLTQSSSLNSSIPQQQSKPLFPYSNTKSYQQESSSIENYNDCTQSRDYNQQNKYNKSVFENSNVQPIDSKLQCNAINSNIQDKIISNQFVTQAQTLSNQNSYQHSNSTESNICNQHDMQTINQQLICSPSKSSTSEIFNNSLPITNHTTNNSSLMTVSPNTSTLTSIPTSSISDDIVQENRNIQYHTSDDQASQLTNITNKSPVYLSNQNLKDNVKSELDCKLSQSPSNTLVESQQEIDQSKIIDNQLNECQYENVNSSTKPTKLLNHENILNSINTTSIQSNYQQPQINLFTSQSSTSNDTKMLNNQLLNNPINVTSQSIKNQRMIEQKFISTSGHNVGQYFNSGDTNNQSVFNKQSQNIQLQSQNQQQNMQNVKPISNFSSNNFMTFPNVEATLGNSSKSSNQQHPTIKKELETNENIKLDSNILSKDIDTSNSNISHPPESINNLNIKLENTEVITDNLASMNIENKQNLPINKSFNQDQHYPSSYFTKEIAKDDANAFSSAIQSINISAPKLNTENSTLPLINKQTNSPSSNPDQLVDQQNLSLSINQTLSDEKLISQPVPNEFASQNFSSNKSHSIPSNQLSPQMFNNQMKSDATRPFQPTSNVYATQSLNNQQNSTINLPISTISNQTPLQTLNNQSISNAQLISSANSIQHLQTPSTALPVPPIASNKLHGNLPKADTIQPQSTSNFYSIPSFDNQSKNISSATNHYQLSKPFNNQAITNTVLPISSANQFPPPMFNKNKSESMPPFQPTKITQPFNQSTQNIPPIVSLSNQLPQQIFGNPPKSGIMASQQTVPNHYQVQSSSNQPTPNIVPIVSTASQNSSHPLNNQSRSMFPSVPAPINQLQSQILNNQIKSDITPSLPSGLKQYPPHQFNNQSRPNVIPQVSSTINNFPLPMSSNQPKLDNSLSNKPIINQYPSQSISNQPILNNPSIQQITNQHSSQLLNIQSKPNTLPHSQPNTNQYPSYSFNNQPSQQVLPKPSSNSFYNPTNQAQPVHNQWSANQNINKLNQQPSNLINLSSNLNQQTQILPPNPLYSNNNYYNQMQGNSEQSLQPSVILPGQNILGSKGYPQQNIGFSNQINYQQPNATLRQQGAHNQQQNQYMPEQNSVVQQGFSKTWGYDNLDLLKSRDILPGEGIQPPEIKLPQLYANCDNCSPDIFRCTLNKFPSSKNLLDKCRLPLGILIHPYKDLSRLTVIQCETITRCRNCRSYINPFVQFIDNGHWKCNLCYRVNELPGEFQIDPYTKTLGDPSRRPEIQNATIEYIASQDYMVRPPQPALYLFLLDVSRTATLSGYLEIVCDRILNKIMSDDIPGDSRTNIGFITYDSSVHFYQIANCDGGQPKQLVVSDISDIFLPLPEGLMVNLEENKSAIKDLLISLPNHYRESYNTGCALGAALQAAFKILAPRGGRVTVFQACLPNFGPGNLQCRDDGNPHTGDRIQHMAPSTDFYKKLALECSAEQIAVDMFFVSSQYLDIATLSGISKYSAGCIHNFPQFDVKSPTIVSRFINCFDRYLSRKIGFEALLRLRCTRGVAIHSFHGNFFVRSSDLLMLPNVNPDNAYGMQLSIEDNLDGISVVCFQAALLYTSSNAERRIRVHTLCIPVTDNINDIFHNADQQAITGLIAKMAVDTSTEKSLSDAREAFFNAISDSLSAFKVGCSSYNGPGTMLSPLSLKMFPLYILATLKHTAFRTNQATRLDERMFSMCQMKSLPLTSLIQYIYPDLYPIHTLEEQPKIDYEKLTEIPLPPVIQLSAERVESNGIYLMDDSETLIIFIGSRCSDQLIQKLFGYVNVNSMPELTTTLAEVDSKPSYLLRSFISYLQHFKPYPLPIEIIKDNGPNKLRFYSKLVEDKFESSLSYYEYLQRLSQQVR